MLFYTWRKYLPNVAESSLNELILAYYKVVNDPDAGDLPKCLNDLRPPPWCAEHVCIYINIIIKLKQIY